MKNILLILLIANALNLFAEDNKDFVIKNFAYYSKEQRSIIIRDLWAATFNQYALWDVKKEKIGVNGDQLFQDALAYEQKFEDETEYVKKAKGNLDFLDRMKKLIASFKDSHFGLMPILGTPYMYNGIVIKEIDNNFYIVATRPKILEHYYDLTGNDLYKHLAIGDKIISIDGKSIDECIKELAPYKNGSSEAHIRESAIYNLTGRNYKYPKKSYNDFDIFSKKLDKTIKVRLPWVYTLEKNRKDAVVYLKSIGIKEITNLSLRWVDKNKTWEKVSMYGRNGYHEINTPSKLKNTNTWLDLKNNREVLRTGNIFKNGKAYGVIQLFSYGYSNIKNSISEKKSDLFTELTAFILELKEAKLPLIFDLRYNGGGNGNYPSKVMSLIARANEVYPSTTSAIRLTPYMLNMVNLYDEENYIFDINEFFFYEQLIQDLDFYIENNMAHSYVYSRGADILPSEKINGYAEPVVALITPNCISACDNQASLFKSSNRVTLIGSHSNGTGAGYRSNNYFNNDPYRDNLFFSIKTHIPNYLFGHPGKVGQNVYEEDRAYINMNSENNPTYADVKYNPTLNDYINHSEDWYNKAIEVIEKLKVKD